MPSSRAPTIIAGAFKGRRLAVPAGHIVRPTRSLVRGALFSMITDRVEDARVLDLFAGAGVLGLEALSRGAAHVTFVERDHRALAALRANIAHCGPPSERFSVLAMEADDLRLPAATELDLLLLDPPFARSEPLPEGLLQDAVLAGHALAVLHGPSERAVPARLGPFRLERRRTHGRSAIAIYRL